MTSRKGSTSKRKYSIDKHHYIPPQETVFQQSFIQQEQIQEVCSQKIENDKEQIEKKIKIAQIFQSKQNPKIIWYIGIIFGLIIISIVGGLIFTLKKSRNQKQQNFTKNIRIESNFKDHSSICHPLLSSKYKKCIICDKQKNNIQQCNSLSGYSSKPLNKGLQSSKSHLQLSNSIQNQHNSHYYYSFNHLQYSQKYFSKTRIQNENLQKNPRDE